MLQQGISTTKARNDYSKDRQFRKLLLLQSEKKVKVIRDGIQDQVSSWDLLVGDVVRLDPGDEVPADGIFISGNNLAVDESPLTGETIPMRKSEKKPFMFSGTQISEGNGLMIVTTVGKYSCAGMKNIYNR